MVVHTRTHTTKINVYYILLLQVQNNDGKRKEGIQCSYSMNFFYGFFIYSILSPRNKDIMLLNYREKEKSVRNSINLMVLHLYYHPQQHASFDRVG